LKKIAKCHGAGRDRIIQRKARKNKVLRYSVEGKAFSLSRERDFRSFHVEVEEEVIASCRGYETNVHILHTPFNLLPCTAP
jgi:hypothetical protein